MEPLRSLDSSPSELEERILAPLWRGGKAFYLLVSVLLAIIAWGAFAYITQAREGLFVTGMRDRVLWGVYIALFVFFIGASMAGTFVSAILRITKAGWRTPVTRSAEMVTVAALIVAGLFITFDIGRPDRLVHILLFGRWESPLIWDVYGLTTYLMASIIYLYVALIPDLAYCRDRLQDGTPSLGRWFFRTFAINWHGSAEQHRYLQIALTVMMVIVIPVAVTMHTVTSWVFAMTLREPWDSPMFGIYFVGGAIFSGIGIIIILMAVLRKVYGLEEFITRKHFLYMGYMLASLAAIMFYFNVSEFVTHAYKLQGHISHYLEELLIGGMAPLYWTYFWGGLIVPMVIILVPFTRNIAGIVVASVLVNIAMLIERYLIVVGGLSLPLNPYEIPTYSPTWVEWSLMSAGIALFILLIAVLLKVVPAMEIAEMLEENGKSQEVPSSSGPSLGVSPEPQPFGGGE